MAARKRQSARPPAPALSVRKLFFFRLLALALPVAVVCLAELGFRWAGYGGFAPMLQRAGSADGGDLILADQGAAASWFFANPRRTGENELQAFLHPKPANTVRIFCVGESAMQGYPQPRQLASTSFLRAMLQDVWPGRVVEVINLGTTAVASFPVLGIMTEALAFEPDLMVIYTGNNEFFGTYGVASTGRAGGRPWMLQMHRSLYSLALVQAVDRWLGRGTAELDRTLMEVMMAQNYVGPNDWKRAAAAHNLYCHVAAMIERCRARGVPVLVCSLPANERDLAPIGNDRLDDLPPAVQAEIKALLAAAQTKLQAGELDPAVASLERILKLRPTHARAHFLLGQALDRKGLVREAREEFVAARDWDTMPWRPPSAAEAALVRAARERAAPVCDLLQAFRDASPGGVIGWELMDDHVHPSLRGQALIAESIVNSLTNFDGPLRVPPSARNGLPPWTEYARRLGENEYDRYGVAHRIRALFNAPFMRANNGPAFERFDALANALENQWSPQVRAALREWQATQPFAGARCPVTAAVAQLELKHDDYAAALTHYEIARQAVPQYTSWRLEYTYYVLYCKQKLHGALDESERQLARATIRQGEFLARHSVSSAGFIERYTGLLHLLCGQYAEAIPFLAASRSRQTGIDRVVVDQTLALCYLQTRQAPKARELLTAALPGAGEFAERYRALLGQLPALEKALAQTTNAPANH